MILCQIVYKKPFTEFFESPTIYSVYGVNEKWRKNNEKGNKERSHLKVCYT